MTPPYDWIARPNVPIPDGPAAPTYMLIGPDRDPPVPSWPYIHCWHPVDPRRSGSAWPRDARARACFAGLLPGSAELVSAVLDDAEPAIERLIALRELVIEHSSNARALFRDDTCTFCGVNHWWSRGYHLERSAMAIHPDADEALRAARPSLRKLLFLDLHADRRRKEPDKRRCRAGLPVCETPAETARAQIRWANEIEQERTGRRVWMPDGTEWMLTLDEPLPRGASVRRPRHPSRV